MCWLWFFCKAFGLHGIAPQGRRRSVVSPHEHFARKIELCFAALDADQRIAAKRLSVVADAFSAEEMTRLFHIASQTLHALTTQQFLTLDTVGRLEMPIPMRTWICDRLLPTERNEYTLHYCRAFVVQFLSGYDHIPLNDFPQAHFDLYSSHCAFVFHELLKRFQMGAIQTILQEIGFLHVCMARLFPEKSVECYETVREYWAEFPYQREHAGGCELQQFEHEKSPALTKSRG